MGGCQIVALNYQTFDCGMQLNRALFQQNRRSGYVLKPDLLRSPTLRIEESIKCIQLAVVVLSAWRLPKPNVKQRGEIIDSFVEVELMAPNMKALRGPLASGMFIFSHLNLLYT
jgi:hypothetical protein